MTLAKASLAGFMVESISNNVCSSQGHFSIVRELEL